MKNIKSQYMFYLVDDQVFIRDFDVEEALTQVNKHYFFSMRMGKNIINYGIKDIPLKPNYKECGKFIKWSFKDNKGVHTWGYQFSVDAHIYRTIDVLRCTMSIPFKAPNTYEANMNSVFFFKTRAKGCTAFSMPVVVNLILNASRHEYGYEDCESGEYNTDNLLNLFNSGHEFDLEKIAIIKYKSAHHIINDINCILK